MSESRYGLHGLVACVGCGVVYDKERACDFVKCPTCDESAEQETQLPRFGWVNQWWNEVEE